ncbi:FeoB-associated Cys-rich membrane protein, partial [Streptococcus pneumoniae]|nr:FeoB-associated Cys-rich membrane protein [Streptococcus pneumoniae]MBZ4299529.1 FeoB-associated Cys-rich membrane protein [Streptococcus pneumoniae]
LYRYLFYVAVGLIVILLWIIRRLRKKKRQSERALKALKEATKEVKVEDE